MSITDIDGSLLTYGQLATDDNAYGKSFSRQSLLSLTRIAGRSIFVMPEGLSDGGDDSAGGHGGKSFSTEAFGDHWAVLVNGPMSDEIPA